MLQLEHIAATPSSGGLAKMNLAVHGLEGDIQQAITYYDDPRTNCSAGPTT